MEDAVGEAKGALPDAKEAKAAVAGALADVKQQVAAAVAPQAGSSAEPEPNGGDETPARECRRWLPTRRCVRAGQRRRPALPPRRPLLERPYCMHGRLCPPTPSTSPFWLSPCACAQQRPS